MKTCLPFPHSKINYMAFRKDFYQEDPDVTALPAVEVSAVLRELEIEVSGSGVPRPAVSFRHAFYTTVSNRTGGRLYMGQSNKCLLLFVDVVVR